MIAGASRLKGRRMHVAGSANATTAPEIVGYGHRVVEQVVRSVLESGGGLVVGVGRELRPDGGGTTAPSVLFDWTALQTAAAVVRTGALTWPSAAGSPLVVVASEKSESEIPEDRRGLWKELLQSGAMRTEWILPGSRAAALIRQRQAEFGDILFTLGGGTGVEHLAELYLGRRRSVIPLDLPLGASRCDGTGGSERLAAQARAEPQRFLRIGTGLESEATAHLTAIRTRNGQEPAIEIADGVVGLIGTLALPDVFYVRLLNHDHGRFAAVESFFRHVADPVVFDMGLERVEMGTDKTEHAFVNVGIFESLHFASVAIVDVTGCRPNCFIELGYALGRGTRVLVTAEAGTPLPFDQSAIPTHFWKDGFDNSGRRKELKLFWQRNIDRPPIVCSGVA